MMKTNKLKIFLLIILSWSHTVLGQDGSSYVWINDSGEGRQEYAYFRNEFDILGDRKIDKAEIHLYASSHFALYVNGQYVQFGPIRSYPHHPYYDSFDIASLLRPGKNVIAVKAMVNGIETFQVPCHTGAFIAWGEVSTGSTTVSLNTPGNWMCRSANGYHPLSPRFSFAKGPVEVYDARKEPDDWLAETIHKEYWIAPVLLKEQSAYGQLMPRTIPYLTQDVLSPKFRMNELDISTTEKIIHFDLLADDKIHNSGEKVQVVAYTYIHSSSSQAIDMSVGEGDFWLNGEKVEVKEEGSKPFLRKAKTKLEHGWNLLSTRQETAWGSLHCMVGLPVDANLTVSPDEKPEDKRYWKVSEPLSEDQYRLFDGKALLPEFSKRALLSWQSHGEQDGMANPAREIAWMDISKKEVDPFKISGFTIPSGEDKALVFDMGGVKLGRIFLDIEAPEGTIIDLTWSEDLRDSLVTLYKRTQINAGARFISRSGKQHFETFKPYGLRYLQLTIRNHREPVFIEKAGMISQHYPFVKRGSFECSDPLMNDIWEMGWRTLLVCAEDAYTDTPFRERGHYAGDMFPQFATTLSTSGDPLLAKHTIRMITDMYEKKYRHEEEIRLEDYPLINILVAAWYIRMFKDRDFASELYPIFDYFMKGWHERKGKEGLYTALRVFFEWIQIDKTATLTSFQVNMHAAFSEMAFLAGELGLTGDATVYRKWADETAETIREKMWDDERGSFFDGIKEGEYLPTRFPGSSAYPSLWGIGTLQQEERLAAYFADALIHIGPPVNRHQLTTPYGGFYALASLYRHENAALAEQFIRKHWGKMVYEANDLTWEDFNRNSHSTMSHAWSSAPTYYLSSQVLGVALGFPGTASPDTIHIQPQSENIQWAKGTVPHPAGDVWVSWKIEGNKLLLDYKAPQGVPVKVKPRGRLAGLDLVLQSLP